MIEEALADVARDRIAGVVVVTDGQAADPPADPRALAELGPAHVLIVGDPDRGDRRLELISAPTFGIVGEPMRIAARVLDDDAQRARCACASRIDGARASERASCAPTANFELDVRLPKRGRNMVIVEAEAGRAGDLRSPTTAPPSPPMACATGCACC